MGEKINILLTFVIHKYIINYVIQKKGGKKCLLEREGRRIIPKGNR